MSYASISDLQSRYDARVIAQLSCDDNSGTINTTNVQAALDDATASINMAALQGSQYTITDLTTLVSSGDTMLVRMCADLTLRKLVERRAGAMPSALRDQIKESEDLLSALRSGKRVLNVTTNRTADTPEIVAVSAVENSYIQPMASLPFFGGPKATPSIYGP